MTVKNDNVRIVLEYVSCCNRGDLEGASGAIDAAAVQEFKGPKPEVLTGLPAIRKHMASELQRGGFLNLRRVVADDNQIAISLERGQGKDAPVRDEAHVFRLQDGKIGRITSYVFEPRYFFGDKQS